MGRNAFGAMACAGLLGGAGVSFGLIVQEPALPKPANTFVGTWNGSSAVAVGSRWVVTAKHVGGTVGQTFVMNGVAYAATAIYSPPPPADLQLIELQSVLPGWHLIAPQPTTGTQVTVVGFGYQAGSTIATGVNWSDQRGETWGQNTLDYVGTSAMSFRFQRSNQGGIAHECAGATHDSGGGVFVTMPSGALRLVGIITSIDGPLGFTTYSSRTYCLNLASQSAFLAGALVASCDGDANGDGSINGDDLTLILSNWGKSVEPGLPGDVNSDGTVDFADLMAVLSNWGRSCS